MLMALVATACEPTNQGYEPTQPRAYSHAQHAGALAIPCRYCHYAASRGPRAGIPAASICMNCHKYANTDKPEVAALARAIESKTPLAWVRVHRLPDHAFFDHQAHDKKLECQDCHGPVEKMELIRQHAPLTMEWCLGCHRRGGDPAATQAPWPNQLMECAVCHH